MGKTASAASAHLAPCLHSASPRAIPVPKNPAFMVSAEMRLEGSAVSVSLAGVAPDAARALLRMPVSLSPVGLVAPVPAME